MVKMWIQSPEAFLGAEFTTISLSRVGKTAGFDEKLCVHRIPPMNFAVSCPAGMGGKNEMGWAMKSSWSETNKPAGRKS